MLIRINRGIVTTIRVWTHIICIIKGIDLISNSSGLICHVTSISSIRSSTSHGKWSLATKDISHVLDILVIATSYKVLIV